MNTKLSYVVGNHTVTLAFRDDGRVMLQVAMGDHEADAIPASRVLSDLEQRDIAKRLLRL